MIQYTRKCATTRGKKTRAATPGTKPMCHDKTPSPEEPPEQEGKRANCDCVHSTAVLVRGFAKFGALVHCHMVARPPLRPQCKCAFAKIFSKNADASCDNA
jgi:hypothetical protein